MGKQEQEIKIFLEKVRADIGSDFVGLACHDFDSHHIRWQYVAGNLNNLYRKITLWPGRGIAGKVVASGRPMALEDFALKSGDDAREYPILLAEDLRSVMAAPIIECDHVKGVLLIGFRTPHRFTEETLAQLVFFAGQCRELLAEPELNLPEV
ncbi:MULTISPECIES: GAF domain-containing protein [Desulfitobacterium]|uniref:GAF domain-containing protein n=4 Tax=Desulfitobacterium TaxID=36853 RepID=Q251B5_DESHY|nr:MULTISPECIES: GAF domain-containing protein [Desulfitobacterium]EHL08042.1 GAF domain protein [Desulfitobacterium hafniense DP7]KTE91561.1 histidine kinase [Desulfitobacterium hafniense]CDX00330.1 GAF domain protein [Desulfitobacterium hafniense]SHN53828.1 nitrogen regulatory protein A [Desulfitobacterium chlororespirans DSM 11544]BAE82127.1 hypothetical protein DSY0338 [Desulfitobacterium hafniense Y51]